MYNSLTNRRTTTTPLMGINNLSKSWYPTAKSGFHTEMNGFLTLHTAAPIGAKCFDNPNFVNGNNPSLLRHQDFYHPPVTKFCKKSPVEAPPPPPSPPPPPEMKMKKKRKRKRRNRRKNKKTTNHNQIVKTDEFPMPELTKSFKDISVEQPELARPRLPSVCESEDSFIVFDDGVADNNNDDDDDGQESAIESDIEVVFEESTEVSENEGMSSDSYTPRKKVRFADDGNLCEIHPMVQWSFAYQAARKGPWEECARDRERFRRRIYEAEKTLSLVLSPLHRKKIFQNRFEHQENPVGVL